MLLPGNTYPTQHTNTTAIWRPVIPRWEKSGPKHSWGPRDKLLSTAIFDFSLWLGLAQCNILGYFTLNWASHMSSSTELSQYVLISCWLGIYTNAHGIQKQHSSKKTRVYGRMKRKTFCSQLMSELGTSQEHGEISATKAWPPPQKPPLLLLEQSPACVREGNNFLQVLRQEWREAFCPKTSCTLWRSPLSRKMAALPSQVYRNSPVTDALL